MLGENTPSIYCECPGGKCEGSRRGSFSEDAEQVAGDTGKVDAGGQEDLIGGLSAAVEVCAVCSGTEGIKVCGGCKTTRYCSKSCQKKHREHHAPYCAAIADLVKLELDKVYKKKNVRQRQDDLKLRRKIMKLL